MVFIDPGANEGYFSIMACQLVGAQGKVIAVEPQKRLAPVLMRNFELNHIHNIVLEQCAVSNENSSALLCLASDMNSGASSLMQLTKYNLPSVPVETVTLEKLVARNGFDFVDLMKDERFTNWVYRRVDSREMTRRALSQ